MARSIHIPKTHLIMALCLPLAVVLGYFLAEPLDSGSMGVVVFVLTILSVPIMMKWYHPLLILSWNSGITMFLLPGSPALWMCMGLGGFVFALLNRSVSPEHNFNLVPSITKPLLFLLAVVIATAALNGGFGIRSLGSGTYGGKAYFYVFAAAVAYFAFASQRIPAERAGLYLAAFFLPGVLALVPSVINRFGLDFGPLNYLFPGAGGSNQPIMDRSFAATVDRPSGLGLASTAIFFSLLVRYGIRGTLDFKKTWRPVLFFLSILGCLASSYRSTFILFAITFAVLFYLEGLHKTKMLAVFCAVGVLSLGFLVAFSSKLPWTVQRTLSFLPLKLDYVVKSDSEASTTWRLEMWREVLPDIPKYLIKGKGYTMQADDLWWINTAGYLKTPDPHAGAILANDYHSGPLSVIVPFGLFGAIGFIWFVGAALRYLYNNYKHGDPSLKIANTVLFAVFTGRIALFLFVFGGFYSDLCVFTGILGLSVSLNGNRLKQPEPQKDAEFAPFSSIADGQKSA